MKNEIIITKVQGEKLTILEGKALEEKYPEKIRLSGNIKSIAAFLEKRYGTKAGKGLQFVDKETAVVVVNKEDMWMKLDLNPQDIFSTTINAKLDLTPELNVFKINTGQYFTREELVMIIRQNRRFFDSAKHNDILLAWMKLELKGSTQLTAASDNRGNKEQAFKKEIDSSHVPTQFKLTLPIFKGFEPESFYVEVCLEATDASVRFTFESVELIELVEKRKEEIFNEQLQSCADFVVIYQ